MFYLIEGIAQGILFVCLFALLWPAVERRAGTFVAGVVTMVLCGLSVLTGVAYVYHLALMHQAPLFGSIAVSGVSGLAIGLAAGLLLRKAGALRLPERNDRP